LLTYKQEKELTKMLRHSDKYQRDLKILMATPNHGPFARPLCGLGSLEGLLNQQFTFTQYLYAMRCFAIKESALPEDMQVEKWVYLSKEERLCYFIDGI
jgi:hypothetical protein